ncbi:MAG: hypothetical protein E7Z84_06965 [Methanosphaera stadtmanae]|nr:hypothetical protein [Methanosphaera stadtmanae]
MKNDPYNIPRKTFVEAFNEVLTEAVRDEGEDWHYFFDKTELLKEILVYRTKIDSYHFTEIFNKYTDYSTSEINECIITHCEVFDEPIEDYKDYSSALDDY